jgi:hypothetical protein
LREGDVLRQPDDELNRELLDRRCRERRTGQLVNVIEEGGKPNLAGTTGYIPTRQAGLHNEWHGIARRAPVQDHHLQILVFAPPQRNRPTLGQRSPHWPRASHADAISSSTAIKSNAVTSVHG